MKIKPNKIFTFTLFFAFILQAYAVVHVSKQPHENAVTMFSPQANSQNFYSVGEDGFIINWDESGYGTHFQVSDIEIKKISINPSKNEIAVYETDGFSIHRVSVWNWQTQTRRYAKRFTDSVISLNYSAKGTYLMVGTAAVDGLIFFDSSTGKQLSKISDTTGSVTMVLTSNSESTCCTYSPSGNLSYYNLGTGYRKAKVNMQNNLEQPTLYNEDLLFAGVKNNTIFINLATTGENLASISAPSSYIVPSSNDDSILYTVNWDERKTYTLTAIKSDYDLINFSIIDLQKFSLNDQKKVITSAFEKDSILYIGTQTGEIYKIPIDMAKLNILEYETPETTDVINNSTVSSALTVQKILPLTEKLYDKILDIATLNDDFYFLTKDALFCSSYYTTTVSKITENQANYTNITSGKNELFLWAKGKNSPVRSIKKDGQSEVLYTPSRVLESLRFSNNALIGIEGNTTVTLFVHDTKQLTTVYTGTGLQDAVLYTNNDLYISKSSSSNPKSPLIHIDLTTKETVMMPVSGDISFSLDFEQDKSNAPIYGISVSADGLSKNTMIFSFNPRNKSVSPVLQWADEDNQAFVYLYDQRVYTNIGKTQVRSHQINNKKEVKLLRASSLPIKLVRNDFSVLVLNKDGSISWYNPDSQYILSDWYLTVNNEWKEL